MCTFSTLSLFVNRTTSPVSPDISKIIDIISILRCLLTPHIGEMMYYYCYKTMINFWDWGLASFLPKDHNIYVTNVNWEGDKSLDNYCYCDIFYVFENHGRGTVSQPAYFERTLHSRSRGLQVDLTDSWSITLGPASGVLIIQWKSRLGPRLSVQPPLSRSPEARETALHGVHTAPIRASDNHHCSSDLWTRLVWSF